MKEFLGIDLGYWGLTKKPEAPNQLQEILDDQELGLLFTQFCIWEFSTENIICYYAIRDYQRYPTRSKLRKLCEVFFNGKSSPFEINTEEQVLKSIRYHATSNPFPSDRHRAAAIVDDALKNAYINLSDTFSRFIFNDIYLQIINKKEWKHHKMQIQNLGHMLGIGGIIPTLLNPLFGIPATAIGGAVLAGSLIKAYKKYKETKSGLKSEQIWEWKQVHADRLYPKPKLGWDVGSKKILDELNENNFDMSPVGCPP